MADRALGTVLKIGANAVGGLTSIGSVDISAEMLDSTLLTDECKTFIQGVKEVADLPISGYLIPNDTNGQVALIGLFSSGVATAMTIEFPSTMGASWSFTAIVSGYKTTDNTNAGLVGFEATLKITGAPTLNLTASAGLTTPFFVISNSAVLTPSASGSVYDYVATVLTSVSSVTITPTATAGVITVNGNTVATGVASSAIALGAAGSVTTVTILVKETAKTAKTYTIRIARA